MDDARLEALLNSAKVSDDLAIAFRLLLNSAKADKARVQCLEVEVACLTQARTKADGDKQLLLDQINELKALLCKKGEEHAEQAELWKQDRTRLQGKLTQRGLEHLRLEQEVEDLRRQLEESASRATQAEATTSIMRSKQEKLGQQLATLSLAISGGFGAPGGAPPPERGNGSSNGSGKTYLNPLPLNGIHSAPYEQFQITHIAKEPGKKHSVQETPRSNRRSHGGLSGLLSAPITPDSSPRGAAKAGAVTAAGNSRCEADGEAASSPRGGSQQQQASELTKTHRRLPTLSGLSGLTRNCLGASLPALRTHSGAIHSGQNKSSSSSSNMQAVSPKSSGGGCAGTHAHGAGLQRRLSASVSGTMRSVVRATLGTVHSLPMSPRAKVAYNRLQTLLEQQEQCKQQQKQKQKQNRLRQQEQQKETAAGALGRRRISCSSTESTWLPAHSQLSLMPFAGVAADTEATSTATTTAHT